MPVSDTLAICQDFNPRSREGSDRHRQVDAFAAKLFQSTLP